MKEKFKALRNAAGKTQVGMSGMLGIPTRTWENWEMGKTSPPEYMFNLIREYLILKNSIPPQVPIVENKESKTYRIVGKPIFGNGQLLPDGTMEEGQFCSLTAEDYMLDRTGASLLAGACEYGAKPACRIIYNGYEIECYLVTAKVCIRCHLNKWIIEIPYCFINTVSPSAICDYVDKYVANPTSKATLRT